MNLTENEFKKLIYISSGTFGAVFHNGKTAFKRYHPLVKANSSLGYQLIQNPCLKSHPLKFKLIKHYQKKLQYTDLNYERLYIDQKFCGICYPYYEGKTLYHLQQLPFQEKENIIKQLLQNAEEYNKTLRFFCDDQPCYPECADCALMPICQGGCKVKQKWYGGHAGCLAIRDIVKDVIRCYVAELSARS